MQTLAVNYDSVPSLSEVWAKKYVDNLLQFDAKQNASELNRATIAKRLQQNLRSISAQAWTRTELLLADEISRHGIDYSLVDPWAIAQNIHQIYDKALKTYAAGENPTRLCVEIGQDIGTIRQKFTEQEPRLIGYVSMHNC